MDNNKNQQSDFPLDVFIDTEVFERLNYDFSEGGKLWLIKKQVNRGAIKLFTSEIVKGEVKNHIINNIDKIIEEINSKFSRRELKILNNDNTPRFSKIDANELITEALDRFEKYLDDTRAICLDIESIELKQVIKDYFKNAKPFDNKKKKSEFPDAFNMAMINKYRDEFKPFYVISGDNDYEGLGGITVYKNIDHLLDFINIEELIAQQARDYIKTCNFEIKEEIRDQYINNTDELELDGTTYYGEIGIDDCYYNKFSVYEINPIKCLNYEIIDLDVEKKQVVVAMKWEVEIEFDCEIFDKVYVECYEDTKKLNYNNAICKIEKHKIVNDVLAYLNYEENRLETEPEFSIEKIEVQMIKQFSYKTLNRKYNYPEKILYCQCCGAPVLENEFYKFNGACVNCAHNIYPEMFDCLEFDI